MNSLYHELKSTLGELLRGRQPTIEPTPRNTYPLFLLVTSKPDVVGFAILDGQPEENYSRGFQNFKDLYSKNSSEWADFDLTLVFCKKEGEDVSDEFCNEIEMDPYFCRKFVIELNKEPKAELGRLPFIPLHPETIVGLRRPISAQTFLMKHRVSSDLARYLVIPHARGIERIVKECLEGSLGEPTWAKVETDDFILAKDETKVSYTVRLKELEINNFRAYRGSHKFDLDADLVVLYGPNGFGKTSFFDALDFICTGGVARFDDRFGRKTDRLIKALKHLDSSVDDSFVKTKALTNGKEIVIERFMKNRTETLVDESTKNRTNTLMRLTGMSKEPVEIRIDNLVRLFRATHLFGQEYQSLTSGFRESSRLPEDTVSRMLAFQDYVEAINKATKVSEELKRQIREKDSKITFFINSLKSKELEMEQLSKSAKVIEKPEAVSNIGKNIAAKVVREIDIQIPKEFNQKIVREWRVLIAERKGFFSHKLAEIRQLEARFPELAKYRKILIKKTSELMERKELIDKIKKDYDEKKRKLEESNEKFKRMFFEENNLSTKLEDFIWLSQAKVDYVKLKEQIADEHKRHRGIQEKLLGLLPKIEELKSESKAKDKNAGKIRSEISALESNLSELSYFQKSVDGWLKAMSRQKDLEIYLERTGQELINVKNTQKIKNDELIIALTSLDKLKKHLEGLQQAQSDLQTLLDNIERHISSNICPVCGTIHKSREELIEKLRFQRGVQPKENREILILFEDTKAKTSDLRKLAIDFELKCKQLKQKVIETQKELLDIRGKIKDFEEKAIALDIPITSEALPNFIESKKNNALEQMNIKKLEFSKQKSQAEKLQEAISTLMKQQAGLENSLRTMESRQSQLQSMIDKISRDASTRQVSLELEKSTIEHELTRISSLIEGLRRQKQIHQTENQNRQRECGNLLEKRNILEKEIREIEREISDSKIFIEEVESLIKKLDLKLDMDMNQIMNLKEDFLKKLSYLNSLRNEIANFEIVLDAIQISAAMERIQHDIGNSKKQIQSLTKEHKRLSDWQSYFDDIYKELEFRQHRAIEEYTGKYGPLASTVQRRLRSVYGFGEIGLDPENGGIAVRVARKGEKNISPSDYFSESQIQIVMLSLFLSAALTQTWSSFTPILLDDPVEHFDDMNVYSLLDLIRALVTEPDKERQFIISTCEDRLFRLMRQKFSKMNGKVIYYKFESIGEKGPKIKRLGIA